MKTFWKQHRNKIILLLCDLLCVLGALVCGPLSGVMLQDTNSTCLWEKMGFACLTCGGTHFVNDLFSGRIGMAFMDHQLLFVATLYLIVSMLALNLYVLFGAQFAKKLLKCMYNIPMLIVWCVATLAFLILRNMEALSAMLQTLLSGI